jgi:hypothetical protein
MHQTTYKSAYSHNHEDLPPARKRLSSDQGILEAPKSNRSDKEHEDGHANERHAERFADNVKTNRRIRVQRTLYPKELCDYDTRHNQNKRCSQITKEGSFEGWMVSVGGVREGN